MNRSKPLLTRTMSTQTQTTTLMSEFERNVGNDREGELISQKVVDDSFVVELRKYGANADPHASKMHIRMWRRDKRAETNFRFAGTGITADEDVAQEIFNHKLTSESACRFSGLDIVRAFE